MRSVLLIALCLFATLARGEGPPAPEIVHHGQGTMHLFYLDNMKNAALYPDAVRALPAVLGSLPCGLARCRLTRARVTCRMPCYVGVQRRLAGALPFSQRGARAVPPARLTEPPVRSRLCREASSTPMRQTQPRHTSGWFIWKGGSGASAFPRPPAQAAARASWRSLPTICSPVRCWDEASCTLRRKTAPMLTSSKYPNGDPRWPVVMHMTGIFDLDPLRNPWAGANQVFVGYCSSDAARLPLCQLPSVRSSDSRLAPVLCSGRAT